MSCTTTGLQHNRKTASPPIISKKYVKSVVFPLLYFEMPFVVLEKIASTLSTIEMNSNSSLNHYLMHKQFLTTTLAIALISVAIRKNQVSMGV